MNIVIVNAKRGGAYRVADFYSKTLDAKLLVNPSIREVFKLILFGGNIDLAVFHSPFIAFKLSLLFKFLSKNTKLYNVEHFVESQILKHELNSCREINKFLMIQRIVSFFGVIPISLDIYSKRNRNKILKDKGIVIYNPCTYIELDNKITLTRKKYDIVWCGRFHKQKMWPQILPKLAFLSKQGLKIVVASQDDATNDLLEYFKEHGIAFHQNSPNWTALADVCLFSSLYEGYPLVLVEAYFAKMKVIAWCDSVVKYQILKHYEASVHVPSNTSEFDIYSLYQEVVDIKFKISLELERRHNRIAIIDSIKQLKCAS